MTNSNETCTCPSGDGSLRHPCPSHQSNENELKVDIVIDNLECRVFEDSGQEHIDNAINLIKQQAEQLESARKEVESLKLNNIRYQWIKNHARTIEWFERDEREGLFNGNKRPLLDQNIDAAIKRGEYKPEDKQS